MLRKHMAYYDFAPDRVLLLGNVLHYAKKAEVEVAELEAENAKLRELVRDMWQEHECCHLTWPATIADRMRELGVEAK